MAEEDVPGWVKALRLELKGCPLDYDAFREQMHRYRTAFHKELAAAIQPRISEKVRDQPQETYDEKRAVASWINREARELGLTTVCPSSGKPAIVAASYRDHAGKSSRFKYIVQGERGRHIFTVLKIDTLNFCEDSVRREGATTRYEHTKER